MISGTFTTSAPYLDSVQTFTSLQQAFKGAAMREVDGGKLLNEFGIDYFKGGSTFGALSEQAIIRLLEKGRIYELRNEEALFDIGSRGDSFFVVLKGTLSFCKQRAEHWVSLHDYSFGEQIGFVTMIALLSRNGKAVATSDSYVLEISNELFYSLHCEMPLDFGLLLMNLSREMARIIVDMGNDLVDTD
ncbi:cyclic nucleotide-binding domain-containing protein [Marinobacterium arenosum]|uniref:cyclic nucleotide-binding domain-containing protein n=1 Tax=Marinobacterium arenosum TaxID=2862496 RepID=UPI001C95838D|nr:cyclic nucleotide-binding domain-containing protein [Marinobacterium arenosum]MBY4677122.1 cyclic nucleotide-binding domain-containing protein [Marinobacterium arenosum]